MVFTVDFNSNETLYMQLCNQVIMGIANAEMQEGDSLPSVRELAEIIGINMHTVNKAYAILRQEGYIKLDRRHGAIIALDVDKIEAMQELSDELRVIIARARCKNITTDEIHEMIDDIIGEFRGDE